MFKKEIIEYIHHGCLVKVQKHLKGKHKDYCLCFSECQRFKPGTTENCEIAQANYENCVRFNIVTPVFECPVYKSEVK